MVFYYTKQLHSEKSGRTTVRTIVRLFRYLFVLITYQIKVQLFRVHNVGVHNGAGLHIYYFPRLLISPE